MSEPILFKAREEFRDWLKNNCMTSGGVWLLFGKTKELVNVKAGEALEEALCFGWIDGLMKRVDEKSYVKYFSARRSGSKWSEKNKALAEALEKSGLMTDFGRAKIEEAKKNGQWEGTALKVVIGKEQIDSVAELLKGNEQAYANFLNMSPSVQKTYTRAYLDARTEAGRVKRLAWMTEEAGKEFKTHVKVLLRTA